MLAYATRSNDYVNVVVVGSSNFTAKVYNNGYLVDVLYCGETKETPVEALRSLLLKVCCEVERVEAIRNAEKQKADRRLAWELAAQGNLFA